MPVQPRAGGSGALVDFSGQSTDTASHQIIATNNDRGYLLIQNNHATADLWVNFGIDAVTHQPSIYVPAGVTMVWGDGGYMPIQAVFMIATAVGATYTIKEGSADYQTS